MRYRTYWKRALASVLALAMCLTLAVSGTVTYFYQASALNVMQDVAVTQVELIKYERDHDGVVHEDTPVAGATYALYRVSPQNEGVLVGEYTTNEEGKIRLPGTMTDIVTGRTVKAPGVMDGQYYWRETAPAPGYRVDPNPRAFTVSREDTNPDYVKDENLVRIVVSDERHFGNLTVTKRVEGVTLPESAAFPMRVTFDPAPAGEVTYTLSGDAEDVTYTLPEDGRFDLKADQTAYFQNLDAGTVYRVEELQEALATATDAALTALGLSDTADALRWTVKTVGNGTILSDATVNAVITNTASELSSVTVIKEITGANASPDDIFTFTVRFPDLKDPAALTGPLAQWARYMQALARKAGVATDTDLATNTDIATDTDLATDTDIATDTDLSAGAYTATDTDLAPRTVYVRYATDESPDGAAYAALNADGEMTLTLKGGQRATFTDLPLGLAYEITEDPGDYRPLSGVKQSGTVLRGGTTVTFVNEKDDTPATFTDLTVRKTVTGLADGETDDTAFAFRVVFGNGDSYGYTVRDRDGNEQASGTGGTFTLKDGWYAVYEGVPSDVIYDVTETPTEGYRAEREKVTGAALRPESGVNEAAFVNEKQTAETHTLTVTKAMAYEGEASTGLLATAFAFVIDLPDGTKYDVLDKDGSVIEADKTLSGGGFTLCVDQSARFKEIPHGTAVYVNETNPGGLWTLRDDAVSQLTVDKDESTVFTNVYHGPVMTGISGVKRWVIPATYTDVAPTASVTLRVLDGEGREAATKTVTPADGETTEWQWSIGGLRKYDAQGNEIAYTVKEDHVTGFDTEITGSMADGFTVTNTYHPGVEVDPPLRLRKDIVGVKDVTALSQDKFVFEFKALSPADAPMPVEPSDEPTTDGSIHRVLYGENEADLGILRFEEPGTYKYTIREIGGREDEAGLRIPGYHYDPTVYTMTIEITETDGVMGWTRTFDRPLPGTGEELYVEIDNDYTEPAKETTSVRVTKVWDDRNNESNTRPESVTMELRGNDGKLMDSRIVSAADGWQWTWEGLPKQDEQGQEIAYTVTEAAVNGYQAAITGGRKDDGTYDFTVTNALTAPDTPTVTLRVTKVWRDNSNAAQRRPDSVTVYLVRNGQRVKMLTLSPQNNWTVRETNLPKLDTDGQVITYTVEEKSVPGYVGKVTGSLAEGYTVTNTYRGGSTPPEGTDVPAARTGDMFRLWLWLLLGSAALVGVAGLTIPKTLYDVVHRTNKGKRLRR